MHRLRCKYLFIFLLSKSVINNSIVIWSIRRPQEKKNIASVKRLSESAFSRRSATFCPKNRLGWTLYTRTAVWKIVRWLWRRGERRPRQWRASQIYGVAAFSTHVFPLIYNHRIAHREGASNQFLGGEGRQEKFHWFAWRANKWPLLKATTFLFRSSQQILCLSLNHFKGFLN